jgi:hypothetical protein
MKTRGSTPNLKQPVTCSYLQPAQPSPRPLTLFPEATINIILTSYLLTYLLHGIEFFLRS